jgi:hypothetical protein
MCKSNPHALVDQMHTAKLTPLLQFQPVSSLSAQSPFLTATQFYDSGIMQRADSKTELLKGRVPHRVYMLYCVHFDLLCTCRRVTVGAHIDCEHGQAS